MSQLATFDFFRYHGVWSPGVRLFRRMRFVGKAAVICAVFLLVLAQLSFLFLRASNRDVEKSEHELAGLAVAREVTPLFNRVQQLRGRLYEAGGQHGNDLKALLGEIEASLARLEARTAQGPIDLAEPMKFVRQSFEPLKTPAADPQEAFSRADEFAQQLQRLLISVADLSGLSMDPDQPAYHLALASTQETQQIRRDGRPRARPGQRRHRPQGGGFVFPPHRAGRHLCALSPARAAVRALRAGDEGQRRAGQGARLPAGLRPGQRLHAHGAQDRAAGIRAEG